MFLLDTNIVSEGIKASPSPKVFGWLDAHRPDELFISVISLAEIRYGIEALPDSAQRRRLEGWYPALVGSFAGRTLTVDQAVSETWGRLRRESELARRTMPVMDLFLAATAEAHGLTLVTRNVRDFAGWSGPILNPWDS